MWFVHFVGPVGLVGTKKLLKKQKTNELSRRTMCTVVVQAGQCGNQVGQSFWKVVGKSFEDGRFDMCVDSILLSDNMWT